VCALRHIRLWLPPPLHYASISPISTQYRSPRYRLPRRRHETQSGPRRRRDFDPLVAAEQACVAVLRLRKSEGLQPRRITARVRAEGRGYTKSGGESIGQCGGGTSPLSLRTEVEKVSHPPEGGRKRTEGKLVALERSSLRHSCCDNCLSSADVFHFSPEYLKLTGCQSSVKN
jgi:hypothetical protein